MIRSGRAFVAVGAVAASLAVLAPAAGAVSCRYAGVCLPVNVPVYVPPQAVQASAVPSAPPQASDAGLWVGGVDGVLSAAVDLDTIQTAGSADDALEAISVDESLSASGVYLEGFGVGAYAVSGIRSSGSFTYDGYSEVTPDSAIQSDRLSGFAIADIWGLAGLEHSSGIGAGLVDYAGAYAGADSEDGGSARAPETLRLSGFADGAAQLYDLATISNGHQTSYLVQNARLSALAMSQISRLSGYGLLAAGYQLNDQVRETGQQVDVPALPSIP